MAITISFEAKVLDGLAGELRARLRGVVDVPPNADARIAEAFTLWQVGETRRGDSRGLGDLAESQERFHHQIKIDGKPVAIAITAWTEGRDRLKLLSVIRSPLAGVVDEAIHVVDGLGVPDTFTARLLVMGSYNVTAFWFVNEVTRPPTYGQLYVIQGPPAVERMAPGRTVDEDRLLPVLWDLPVIRGWTEGNVAQDE